MIKSGNKKMEKGEIDLTNHLHEHFSGLFMTGEHSDVTFLIEERRLLAHRNILAARSDYFRGLLYGSLNESTQKEITLNVPGGAFKEVLQYMYTGRISLTPMDTEMILEVLHLSHMYGLNALATSICLHLAEVVTMDTVVSLLETAQLFENDILSEACYQLLDKHTADFLQHISFQTLAQEALCILLKRDSFFAPEAQIFVAVQNWYKHNSGADIDTVVSLVRFDLMNVEQLWKVVWASSIVHPDRLLPIIKDKSTSRNLQFNDVLWPNMNVAHEKHGSKVILGDGEGYGCMHHDITENFECILIELGAVSVINHIQMSLKEGEVEEDEEDEDDEDKSHSISYFIEVSGDMTNWHRVIDHSNYKCRSLQDLYFPCRTVRYIRLVGTGTTAEKKVFEVARTLKAVHIQNIPKMLNGFVAPKLNVATFDMGAKVLKGEDILLNGDTMNYDSENGYASHELDEEDDENLVIQLGQPYYIESMRMLLLDVDDRSYQFYIETSLDKDSWTMVADKRSEYSRSWQTLTFEPTLCSFIRIVGTYCTDTNTFDCVHFECPAQLSTIPVNAVIEPVRETVRIRTPRID